MKPLTFFEKKIGQHVLRGSTKVFIDSLETANRLFYLQDEKKNYLFTEIDSLDDFFADEKPAIRIHRNLEECESCGA